MQAIERLKMLVTYISDKRFVSRIYKDLSKMTNKKWATYLNKYCMKEDMYIVNNYI